MEMLGLDPMDAPFKKNAKFADLDSLPDNKVGQIIDGDLYASPRPAPDHQVMIGALFYELHPYMRNRSRDGWFLLIEAEVRFGRNLLIPDLAGWRRSRLPPRPWGPTMQIAPDWVCEGLSPSTTWLDKGRKREIYAKAGVSHMWLAHPRNHEIDVMRLEGKRYSVVANVTRGRVVLEPFEKPINVDRLWEM